MLLLEFLSSSCKNTAICLSVYPAVQITQKKKNGHDRKYSSFPVSGWTRASRYQNRADCIVSPLSLKLEKGTTFFLHKSNLSELSCAAASANINCGNFESQFSKHRCKIMCIQIPKIINPLENSFPFLPFTILKILLRYQLPGSYSIFSMRRVSKLSDDAQSKVMDGVNLCNSFWSTIVTCARALSWRMAIILPPLTLSNLSRFFECYNLIDISWLIAWKRI